VIKEGEQRIVFFSTNDESFSARVYRSATDQREFAKGREGGVQICSHSWIIVFPFGVEKSRLHEDQARYSRSSIGNDADDEMAIQERSSFFGPCIAIVIGVAIFTIVISEPESLSLSPPQDLLRSPSTPTLASWGPNSSVRMYCRN